MYRGSRFIWWAVLWCALVGLLILATVWLGRIDLVEVVRCLRYNIPGPWMGFIAENTFELLTGFLVLSLGVFGWLGLPVRPIPLLLLSGHLVVLRAVWEIMRGWYGYFWWAYLVLAVVDLGCRGLGLAMSFRGGGGRPWNYANPWVRLGKMLLVLAILAFYLVWTLQHQEPLTHHPLTPTHIPGPLCPRDGDGVSFEDWILNDYARLHERMLHPQTPDHQRRFLVFHTSNDGLGNRIQGLLSTFLMAILLDRAFLVDWQASAGESEAGWEDLFGPPPFTRGQGIDVRRLYRLGGGSRMVSEYWEHGRHWVPYCRACPMRSLPSPGGIWDQLLCHGDLGVPANRPVHRVISTLWFAPAIQRNPHFRQRICKWRGADEDLFGMLFRAVLVLAPPLQKRADQYVREHFRNRHVIGMHLRMKEGSSIDELVKQTILRCASRLETLYRGRKPVRWFIATDHLEARKELSRLYEKLKSDDSPTPLLMLDLDETSSSRRAVAGIQAALMEIWLLGHADELIISPYSTFSYVAHGRTGVRPHVATRNGKCFQTLSTQPCALYWFGMTLAPCFKVETMFTSEMINNEDCWM